MSILPLAPALPWLAPYLWLVRLARRTPNLRDAPVARGRRVSVIIPARNEAAIIQTVLASILASDYEPLEVIVVDDRSTDETAELVARVASGDTRVRLVRGAELPPGWFGKPWACHQGARAATGDLLLFTDADTRHAPELLGRAVGALQREGAGLLTVAPHQACVTFWERVVMPQIWLLLSLRYHPRTVNRAARARDVIANGQFILTTRTAYARAGGHEGVRGEVAEDLALAQAYLAAGQRLYFAFAMDLMETRMYHGLGHLIEGWSKNIYLGGRRSFPDEPGLRLLVPAMLTAAMVFWLVPVVALAVALSGAAPALLAPAAAAAGLSLLFWAIISAGMDIPPLYGLGYPLGAAMALYIIARSTWRGARRVEWKGRVYSREREKDLGLRT